MSETSNHDGGTDAVSVLPDRPTRVEDAKMARMILREVRFTLAQAKGYIGKVSAERSDGGGAVVAEIAERMAEVEALQERFRRVSAGRK